MKTVFVLMFLMCFNAFATGPDVSGKFQGWCDGQKHFFDIEQKSCDEVFVSMTDNSHVGSSFRDDYDRVNGEFSSYSHILHFKKVSQNGKNALEFDQTLYSGTKALKTVCTLNEIK